jgi:hypothetical protein
LLVCDACLVVDALGEDLVTVEELDGEVAAGGAVARVLDLAEVALPEGPPDLIPPQQRRTRALLLRLSAVHHSQSKTDSPTDRQWPPSLAGSYTSSRNG